jgi:SAM-dependent methyltransferase
MTMKGGYGEDLSYIHDAAFWQTASDAAWRLVSELHGIGLHSGTVVDLGCGSGVLAHQVSRAGLRVVGIDLSAAMIALARARAPDAEFQLGSFVSAAFPGCVAITAIGEVLNYAFDETNDDQARLDLFQRAHDALMPGGLLMFDVAGVDRGTLPPEARTFAEGDDWAVLVETVVDESSRLLTRRITSFRQVGTGYRRAVETHQLALIDVDGVTDALNAIGFRTRRLAAYGSYPLPPGVVGFLARKSPRGALAAGEASEAAA